MIMNGMADHVHLLIGIKPDKCIEDLVRDIKSNSSKFMNEQGFVKGRFEWQKGFGAFSVSQSQVQKLIGFIQNQKVHHKKRSFHTENLSLLKALKSISNQNICLNLSNEAPLERWSFLYLILITSGTARWCRICKLA